MRSTIYCLISGIIVSGCASSTETVDTPAPDPVRYRIEPRAGAVHFERRLAGAAYVEAGSRHVLTYTERDYRASDTASARGGQDSSTSSGSDTGESGAGSATSDDESDESAASRSEEAKRARELWRRFCAGGRDMTAAEFDELAALRDEHPMPVDLADDCSPPK